MKRSIITTVSACLLATAARAEVRVFVEDSNGSALLKYQCTAGEVMRAFALNVTIDRGQIVGISNFFVGPSTASAHGYGIFPAAFRDHVAATVTSGTVANWNASGYNPVASVADAPSDTLAGLGSSGVTLEFGAVWDASAPTAAPAASGTLCTLQLSTDATLQGTNVTLAANASRGGVVASPNGTTVTPTMVGAHVGPVPRIAVEQPLGSPLTDGGSADFGGVVVGTNASLTFTIRNPGTGDLTGLAITGDGSNSADFAVTSNPLAPVSGPSGSTPFTVTFTPAAVGSRNSAIHIANNDAIANPFDINLTGTGITAFQGWTNAAGLPVGQAGPEQMPQGDGVPNLLKFAFNLDPTKPDTRVLSLGAGGTAGLPGGARAGGGLRLEYLRRKASTHPGITYTAQF
ncbi:MAG: choice-of-anchor D domain-containing protein, partial [Verrucomicrobiota bacterium]